MASTGGARGKQRQRLVELYPDPSGDDAPADPYYALRQARAPEHDATQQHDSEANRQYLRLANQLPAHLGPVDEAPSEDDDEALPVANSYLNLDLDVDDTDLDEARLQSAFEGETDNDTDTGTGRPGPARIPGKRRRGWKWALKGTAHDPKLDKDLQDKPPRMNRPKGRKKKAVDPGHEFKAKQAKATQAFVEGRFDDALNAAREAVHANPEVFVAHSLLSEILLAQGHKHDSLGALLTGAIVARKTDTWIMAAERTLDLAAEEHTKELLQQAIFCYKQAIDLEKDAERTFDARVAKMQIWLELGELTKARRDCKLLVGMRPGDIDLVRQMAELCAMTGDSYETNSAKKSYEYALAVTFANVHNMDDDVLSAAWGHLNIYLELVDRSSPPLECIAVLKQHARRFLDRSGEIFWDNYQADDREWDVDHMRRYEVIEFQQGRASRDRAKYGEALPLELRIKLGLFRLKSDDNHLDEALRHFSFLMQYRDDVEALFDMFYLVATNLSTRGLAMQSIPYYEVIQGLQDVLTDEFWIKYGSALRQLKRFEEAAACYEKACAINPLNLDAKVDLAHLYQGELKDNERAWKLVDDIIAMNKRDLLRREKLHMRPRQRGRMKSALRALQRGREQVGEMQSSDDDDGEDDLAVQPVGGRKRRKGNNGAFVPSGRGSYGGFALDDAEGAMDVDENGVPLDDAAPGRKRYRKPPKEKRNTKGNERRLEILESAANRVQSKYATVERLWEAFEEGTDQAAIDEWTEAALKLYEIFRSVKAFYPSRDKHKAFRGFLRLEPGEAQFMSEMESWKRQLEGNGEDPETKDGEKDYSEFYQVPKPLDDQSPKDFYDIPFATWHHIFVDLALLYARRSRQTACYQIIDDGMYGANVFFHDNDILLTTQATSLCCGFIFNDSERLCFAARWFMNRHDLRTGSSFQLFSAVNRLSFGSSLWFSAGPTQKHMLRSIKALDYHYMAPEIRKKFDWSLQLPTLRKRVEKYGDDSGHLDPNALLTYGHMVGVANHSQSALPYFFRAYALQPENVTVNLSIATQYIMNALKRQTDNRQYGIQQGVSFLFRYYQLRTANGGAMEKQEAEFNVGRTWHMLGLTHLAIGAYERALALYADVEEENRIRQMEGQVDRGSLSAETAYALVQMYATAGNDQAAKYLTDKWLVL